MCAGAVHGTGEYAVADIHHPRGLHGLEIVLWSCGHLWSGCVSRDVLADTTTVESAYFAAHSCHDPLPHYTTPDCTPNRPFCCSYCTAYSNAIGPTVVRSFFDSHIAPNDCSTFGPAHHLSFGKSHNATWGSNGSAHCSSDCALSQSHTTTHICAVKNCILHALPGLVLRF